MSEFIGSRISLISKSDVRYVGTLHEINSESSTVALEQVKSFGTESRRTNPAEQIPGSDGIYDYIVFRGSDVKDLRIEEPPKESKPPPPQQVPNDPAILGSARPQGSGPPHPMQHPPQGPPPPNVAPGHFPPHAPLQMHQQFLPGPGAPPHGYHGGPQAFPGYPGMPYGPPPPGYFPPQGQGYPNGPSQGPFPPHGSQKPPSGPQVPGQQGLQHAPQSQGVPSGAQDPKTIPQRPGAENQPPVGVKPESQKLQTATHAPATSTGPPPPVASKPNAGAGQPANYDVTKGRTALQTDGKIVPAMPRANKAPRSASNPLSNMKPDAAGTSSQASAAKPTQAAADAAAQYQNATTQAATAAVAAAMAKLAPNSTQPAQQSELTAADNLSQRVNEMRNDNGSRGSSNPRGRGRGGGRGRGRGIEVPRDDFDFASANAKFSKQDLVKEAIATGEPSEGEGLNGDATAEPTSADGAGDVTIPGIHPYNSKTSFFDNISSDARDRNEVADEKRRPSGAEFRHEERKKNLETFGMGSVDGGYRGGYRGRGRGRGHRGYNRGGYRGRGSSVPMA